MIRNIIFDMGQVFIHFTPEEYISRLGITGEDASLLLREVFRRVEWVCLDRGTMTEEEAVSSVCQRLPGRLHHAAESLIQGWWKGPIVPMEGMEALAAELKERGYHLYMLTNASRRVREYMNRIPAAKYMDGCVVSAECLLLKPETEIYLGLCRRYGLKPEECFFIDDAPVNVEGAYRAGLNGTVFFGDISLLRQELCQAGVQVSC